MKKTIFFICLSFLFIALASVPSSYAQGKQEYKVGEPGPAGGSFRAF